MQLVKEFFADLDKRVEDKVFVGEKWVDILSRAINNMIRALDHE